MQTNQKRCKTCQQVLPYNCFEKNQYNKAGEVIRRASCKECRKRKKPIPSARKRDYELRYPRPKIDDSFHCPVCQRTIIVQKNRDVNLDHDHETGEIRGYVCNDCNTGMGNFNDNVSIILRAVKWINRTLIYKKNKDLDNL